MRSKNDGRSKTKLYKSWVAMKRRCDNPDKHHARYYNGISIFEDWYDFDNFRDWALLNGYIEGYTIERLDITKGYYPSNCTWIPREEQNDNKRNNHVITIKGVSKNISQWCKQYNIKWTTFYARLRYGYKDEDLLYGRRR